MTPNPNHPPEGPHAAPTAAPQGAHASSDAIAADAATKTKKLLETQLKEVEAEEKADKEKIEKKKKQLAEGKPLDENHNKTKDDKSEPKHIDASGHGTTETEADKNSLKKHPVKNVALPTAGVAAASAAVTSGAAVAGWPVIGKLPFLPAIAESIQSGIVTASTYLGMNTGTATTAPSWLGWAMSYLPNAAGPVAVGAAGLWGLGKANEWLTGRPKSGYNVFKTMWNGVRAPVDITLASPRIAKNGVVYGYNKITGGVKSFYKAASHGVGGVYNWTSSVVKKNLRAGIVAAAAAGILAPFTGGSSLVLGATGFFGTKIAESQGLVGGAPKAEAHAADDGGHH